MQRRYFGTDGVRGAYGGPVVTEAFFGNIGAAAARWLEAGGARSGRVLIGRDTRRSGASLAAALGAGFLRGGARPFDLGIVPTPAVSGAVRMQGAALGAVVTASHNPASDNGVKFFGPDGTKLSDADEAAMEALLDSQAIETGAPPASPPPPPSGAALESYIAAASHILPAGSLRGWKIALDTANGATCATSPAVLRALGAELVGIGGHPDGLNINAGVGSEHPEALVALVRENHARLGIAHDGDGDRCLLCDEQGGVLDGDELLAILATHALRRGLLAKKTLVVTVQSNLGVDFAVAEAGGRVIRTAVGDRYVTERMRAEGATLGGESSGHIVCFDVGPTGDGLAAALKVVGVMLETGRPLSELRKALRKFPQVSTALRVREKKPLESLPALSATIRELERELGERGRVLVRYSGTEAKLRLLVEGPTEAVVASGIGRLRAAAGADLEVVQDPQ
jgi:phosphoglucosamine mutase